MADEKRRDEKKGSEDQEGKPSEEGGLGNLPPLSDFDSGGFQSDSALPPLGSLDSDSGKISAGGLPPITDITVETPKPTGGNIKPPPAGFEMAESEFQSPTFDTPQAKPKKVRGGFQDPAADSDFSPETPEIGPGPDSDMDTPMFDSAFGQQSGGFTPAFDTPAPTQAMETPMFDSEKPGAAVAEGPTFDEGAFTAGRGFEAGTPAPDFSPDTAMGPRPPLAPEPEPRKVVAAPAGARSMLITVLAAVICLVVGLVAGPFVGSKVSFLPNPLRTERNNLQTEVLQKDARIQSLQSTIDELQKRTTGEAGPVVSEEKIKELMAQQDKLTADIQNAKTELEKTTTSLNQVRADLEAKNEEFVKAQEAFEDLQNQTAIVQARQMGLVAEVDRLTDLVGKQEEAVQRSRASKEALQASIERLMTQVKEGIPLTPENYARDRRLAAVEDLKARVDAAKWVTPELLDEYTSLYQEELAIAASSAYFFAKIPVTNRLGTREMKWAECLMKGNWAVYYRALDGKNVGSYENVAEPGKTPEYAFRETLPDKVQKEIESEIIASRVPDAEMKLKALAEKQVIMEGGVSPFQKVFSSL
jgi:hypothetical protein